jgi:hypothetical protein
LKPRTAVIKVSTVGPLYRGMFDGLRDHQRDQKTKKGFDITDPDRTGAISRNRN